MGFRIRKSISAGPFRFNLSKSGVGVSVGVPGFRVGAGPRGNYVHVGRGGLSYRATLSGGRPPPPPPRDRRIDPRSRRSTASAERFERIESGDVRAMVDGSAEGLLGQIHEAERYRPLLHPVIVGGFAALVAAAAAGAAGWLLAALAGAVAAAAFWSHLRDEAGGAVVLFYDLEPEAEAAFEELQAAFARLAGAHAAWNVQARAEVGDWKRNAGASGLVQRQPVRLGMGVPPAIRTNVDVPAIPSGTETLYFFPDRLLVAAPRGIGAVRYEDLEIGVETTQFIESGPRPGDAAEVGSTWEYVNKQGGPDRRFASNRQLPVLLYEQVTFTSRTGLREVLHLSRTGGGAPFRSAVEGLARIARSAARRGGLPAGAAPGATPPDPPLRDFSGGVVDHLVVRRSLPRLMETLAEHGIPEARVRAAEALLFAALPFDSMARVGHLGEAGEPVGRALREALALEAESLGGDAGDGMAARVEERLDEYAGVAFDEGAFTIRENGMFDLAIRAYSRMVGDEPESYAIYPALFSHFAAMCEAVGHGARLGELFRLHCVRGEEAWAELGRG